MTIETQTIAVGIISLDEWLELVFDPPSDSLFIDCEFPTDRHKEEYLTTIHNRTDEEVKKLLLRFLVPSCTLGIDKIRFRYLVDVWKSSPEEFKRLMQFQYNRRLLLFGAKKSPIPPWEGITWVLDLLPHFPKAALEGIAAYTFAHIQLLPDRRLTGMWDAEEVIRAKYIGYPHNQEEKIQALMTMSPRQFEHLAERLYSEMGYETQLTPSQKDGGRDVIAFRKEPGKTEHLRIECKHYSHPVGVEVVRALLGVVSDEKVNKGVLVTSSRFTRGAIAFATKNPRIELIPGTELVVLLNEHLGTSWPLRINQYVLDTQRADTGKENNITYSTST
jgi:restriction system protein